jgi:hypothetical protein
MATTLDPRVRFAAAQVVRCVASEHYAHELADQWNLNEDGGDGWRVRYNARYSRSEGWYVESRTVAA